MYNNNNNKNNNNIIKRALVKLQVLLLFYTKELNLILEIRFVLTYLKKKRVRLKKKE